MYFLFVFFNSLINDRRSVDTFAMIHLGIIRIERWRWVLRFRHLACTYLGRYEHSHHLDSGERRAQRWRIDLFSDIASPQTQSNSPSPALPRSVPSTRRLKVYISSGTNMFHYSYKHNLPGTSRCEYMYKCAMSKREEVG